MDGVINVYKEKGYTSHDVVAVVRKTLNIKKVGHTGTLDPDAEGVLPICIGSATKLADYIMSGRKSYRAEISFGSETTTQDASGEVIKKYDYTFDEGLFAEALKGFVGVIQQLPPMYSAIKVNGKKLYELAREGKEIERKTRKITIFDIRIVEISPPSRAIIDVDCSKGTYIRTLCSDIGKALGWGAYMSGLTRTATGSFKLENAVKLDELKAAAAENRAEEYIIPPDNVLSDYKSVMVSEKESKYLYNGGKISVKYLTVNGEMPEIGETVLGYDFNNKLVGIYTYAYDETTDDYFIKPVRLML
ncbi:MAG: tRNA pseudouridine(55) synthase TruB [Candidatus Metalachnospira sp.]|nr:tRNA pseudouridine(55) synthase TruB [Candidatus Metalachnospira sp.]